MTADIVPAPPSPTGDLKAKKKGFLGMFKGKKVKVKDIDATLKDMNDEQDKELKKSVKKPKEEKEVKKPKEIKQEKEEKINAPIPEDVISLEQELAPPAEPETTSPEKEVNLDDLEKLEADLESDGKSLDELPSEPEITASEEDAEKEGGEFEEPEVSQELPETQKTEVELETPEELDAENNIEEIVEQPKPAKIPKKTKHSKKKHKSTTHKAHKIPKKTIAKVVKPKEEADIKPELKSVDLSVFEPEKAVIPKVKIRKRRSVEKHFKGLEKDHKKIYAEIHKVIKRPEEKIKPEHFFILKNGAPIKNLRELIKFLKIIDDETFKYHVNSHKNDFANWVKEILKKEKLAQSIRDKKAKTELLKVLEVHEKEFQTDFLREKKAADTWKKDQLNLIKKVKNARDDLYNLQAELDGREKELKKREDFIKRSKAFNVPEFKKKLQKQYDDRDKARKLYLEKAKITFKKEKEAFAKESSMITTKKKEVLALERKYNSELKSFTTKQTKLDLKNKKLDQSLSKLRDREKELKKKESEASRQLKSIEVKERVIKRKAESIDVKYAEDKELQADLEVMQGKIAEQKESIEKQGFKEYVKEELSQMYPQNISGVTNIDGSLDMVSSKNADIHDMILQCRKLLNQMKISEAQEFYNQIKSEYAKRKISPKEKEKLHNKILELYDDIHLALMR